MECEKQKHPIVGIEGFAAAGKQFDLDITIPEDARDVIYGIVKDCYKNPVCDAVVKLIEVEKGCKEERKPVSHTFTDKHGEFVFGPLCPHKLYAIEIWANKVDHIKICAKCNREGNCLKGIEMGPCDCFMKDDCIEDHKKDDNKEEKKDYKPYYEDEYTKDEKKCDNKDDYKKEEKNYSKDNNKNFYR